MSFCHKKETPPFNMPKQLNVNLESDESCYNQEECLEEYLGKYLYNISERETENNK